MFTGIIEDKGTIVRRDAAVLVVRTVLDDIHIGDSVAVDGVCLTATSVSREKDTFLISFDFSPETASRTALSGFSSGKQVNLERAMAAGGRLGGHILTGHIEDTGTLISAIPKGNSMVLTFSAPESVSCYIVPKGSIGVNGISLTIADRTDNRFSVSVIPHTLAKTTFAGMRPGTAVNLEPDILAKYVEHFLYRQKASPGKVTEELLKENGFF